MTDLSQAIVNGANIAMGLRDQEMKRQALALDESYRRDDLAFRRKQHGEQLAFDKEKFTDLGRRDDRDYLEGVRRYDDTSTDRKRELDQKDTALGIAQSEENRAKAKFQQEQIDSVALAQVAMLEAGIMTGQPFDLGQWTTNVTQNDVTLDEASEHITGDPKGLRAVSDKTTKPVAIADKNGDVGLVYKMPDGSIAPMDNSRSAGVGDGTIAKVPGAMAAAGGWYAIARSPKAMAQLSRTMIAQGLINEGAKDEEVLRVAAQTAADRARSGQAAPAPGQSGMLPGGGAPPTLLDPRTKPGGLVPTVDSLVAEPPAPPVEPQGFLGNIGASVRALKEARRANLQEHEANSEWTAINRASLADQFNAGLEGRAPMTREQLAAQVRAERAPPGEAPPSLDGPRVTPEQGELNRAAAETNAQYRTLAATRERRNAAIRHGMARTALGIDANEFGAEAATGNPNSAIAQQIIKADLTPFDPNQTTESRQKLVDLYFPKGNSKDIRAQRAHEMGPGLIDLLNNMSQNAVDGGTPNGHAMMSLAGALALRAQGDDGYAEMLRSNPYLVAAAAFAGVNPTVVGEKRFFDATEQITNAQNSNALSPMDIATLYRRLLGGQSN